MKQLTTYNRAAAYLNTILAQELKEAADALGITIGTVIKDPMEGLVKYHSAE